MEIEFLGHSYRPRHFLLIYTYKPNLQGSDKNNQAIRTATEAANLSAPRSVLIFINKFLNV